MSRAANLAAQEESRLALAAEAARAEQQNQPKALLYGAGVLFLGALIFLGVEFNGSRTAASDLATQKKQADDVIQKAGLYKSLLKATEADPSVNQPVTLIRTRIEQAGLDVGLKSRVPIPIPHEDRQVALGSKQTRLDYEVRDEDLPKLLQWVEKCVADIRGLEVYGVSLRPEAHQWILRVSFSRWERLEGT